MDMFFVRLLRCFALALMLGGSLSSQAAQVISLELSLSATDMGTLVSRIPQATAKATSVSYGYGSLAAGPVAATSVALSAVAREDAAFASAASTNGWLGGMAAPLLMLAGLLVLGLVRQQRASRFYNSVSL